MLLSKLLSNDVKKQHPTKNNSLELDESIVYNIDWYYSNYGLIDLKGWVYSKLYTLKTLSIVLDNGVEKSEIPVKVCERQDVKAIYNLDYADIGIEISISYSSFKSGTTYLKAVFDNQAELLIKVGSFDKTELYGSLEVGYIGEKTKFENHLHEKVFSTTYKPKKIEKTIDIIIPVYNDFKKLERLLESIKKTNCSYNIYIVDDCSTDKEILPLLQELESNNSNITLIRNKKKLGFVRSVNIAIEQSKNDVVIVNTDVVLPDYWLERIIEPLVYHDEIATATPFTNNGNICSFPNFCESNDLYMEKCLDDIDLAFSKIHPRFTIIPTGVIFCMAMKRSVIDKIGGFDEENFNNKYYAETDWCQRAIKAGYINVIVENLFVWHKPKTNPLSSESKSLLTTGKKKLLEIHPKYDEDNDYYYRSNPHKHIRNYIKWELLKKDQLKYYIAFNHDWGGGADMYLTNKFDQLNSKGIGTLSIKYNIVNGLFLEHYYKTTTTSLYFKTFTDIDDYIKNLSVHKIIINELVTFRNIKETQKFILKLKQKHSCETLYLVHDFYCICPSVNLLDSNNKHCWFPKKRQCNNCHTFNSNNNAFVQWNGSISSWRTMWKKFLSNCDEIRVFSNNSKKYLNYYYKKLSITVVPHKINYINHICETKKDDIITIAFIGNLTYSKGGDIVCEMSDIIKKKQINARIIVVGHNLQKYQCKNVEFYGSYDRENLGKILEEYNTDIITITSIWPETFSYTTEEAMALNLPVACLNIGAPSERVINYSKGIVVDEIAASSMLNKIIEYYSNK